MPGHTRHIQSLILDNDIELLDCPGLVLPAYAVAPDLLLTAVLPIDQVVIHDLFEHGNTKVYLTRIIC